MDDSPDWMYGTKLASMAGLMCATLACGIVPLWALKGSGKCSADPVLSLVTCFSGGVFLSACLLDLVPHHLCSMSEAFHSLEIKLHFPLPEFLLSMGVFLVLVMEQAVLAYKDQSQAAKEERWARLMEPCIQLLRKEEQGRSPVTRHEEEPCRGGGPRDDPAHLRLAGHSFTSFTLVLSLSLHAALEGMAVSLWGDGGWRAGAYTSLLLRRCLVAAGLAVNLGRAQLRCSVVTGCLLLFSLASLVGVALAEATSPSHQLAQSTLGGLAAGAFLCVTCTKILTHQQMAPHRRLPRLALLLAGFAVFAGTLFIKI
ncbi:zinc transporter ZIP1-like [Anguilla rostrata]|uniref:zinc transporter ZIP1-like n=1 Tax=Anguilla rostrata TaxID=7938 RepID=UPI0030CF9C83